MIDQNSVHNSSSDDEISFSELIDKAKESFQYLVSRWMIILAAGILGAAIGLYSAWGSKSVFNAKYTFVLEEEQSGGLGGALGLASQFGLDLGSSGGGAFSGDNLIELMKSRTMVQQALLSPIVINGKSKSLADYYIEIAKLREAWSGKPQLANLHFPLDIKPSEFNRNQDSIMTFFHKTLTGGSVLVGRVDKKSSIIAAEVKSENEIFAKFFCEALVNEVSRFYIETKTKKSSSNVSILRYQTDSVRRQLDQAITGVAISSDNTPNLNAARQILRTPSQKRQIDVQANTAILTELVKNLELAKFSLSKETPLIQVIDKPIMPLPSEKVSRLKRLIIGGLIGGILITIYLLIKQALTPSSEKNK